MTHPDYIRMKAREMRTERGFTIDEIAERLALSRTTIYHWVRDIPIERNPERQSAAQRTGTRANVEKHRRNREAAYRRGVEGYEQLATDPTFRDFVCIGEGSKRCRNTVALANSDPVVISLAHRWLRCLATNKVFCSLQYHADQDPEFLRRFWGFRLGVEPGEIALQRKSNSNQLRKRTWRSRWGVATVGSKDTYLRARLQGWIDTTKLNWTTG